MKNSIQTAILRVVKLAILASFAGVALFLVGAWQNGGTFTHWFLLWNLALAWLPLLFALALIWFLQWERWLHWCSIALTILWLTFLPNAFYMITDYTHLFDTPRADYNFDALMFTMIIMTSVAIGLFSLVLVHHQLRERIPAVSADRTIAAILFLCGVAIYVGRELRWNTWDLLFNPAGLLFDLSEIVLRPWEQTRLLTISLAYFAGLGLVYFSTWRIAVLIKKSHS